jgi:CDP-diacylglycerol--glycerol-3-phosphate 3-phosphatidyltransferase
MSSIGKRNEIAVSEMGKYKTFAQMLSLQGLIWRPDYDIPLILFDFPHQILMGIAYSMFFVATILTIWSMVSYFIVAWPELKAQK